MSVWARLTLAQTTITKGDFRQAWKKRRKMTREVKGAGSNQVEQ